MVFDLLKLNIDVSDDEFNSIYPERIKSLSKKHWSPVLVSKLASEFLVERPGARVLDIGSGVGKFCMIGAALTRGFFTGVEQRADLVEISQRFARLHNIQNIKFIQSNITSIEFREYDAFYFYNSFHENIVIGSRIDDTVKGGSRLYDLYSLYTFEQLSSLPAGARLVTYCSSSKLVPIDFKLIYSLKGGLLKFFEKME